MGTSAKPDGENGLVGSFPKDIWDTLPPVAQAFIQHLLEENRRMQARIEDLEEQLKTNSSNSSRPPSSDSPWAPRKRKKKSSGRHRGGQKGHKGNYRKLFPEEKVTTPHDYYPNDCENCGHHFKEGEKKKDKFSPSRHQIVEIPRIEPEIHEHRQHSVECPICGHVTTPMLPEDVPSGAFGPRLASLAALLTGRFRISRRDVEELLSNVLGIQISLGGIKRVEELVSKSLKPAFEEAAEEIQKSRVVNMDETGWKEQNQRCNLWNANTPSIAVYWITINKDRATAQKILGKDFNGILGTDRAPTYFFQSMRKWQMCLAHIERNCEKIFERSGFSKEIGKKALDEFERVFDLWGSFKDGEIDRDGMKQRIVPIRARMGKILKEGSECGNSKTENTCKGINAHFQALWTFVREDGVEPTNNSSERALRSGVRWRRVSFGTQSSSGSRFVERMLTTIETCRRQGRNVLDFLTDSVSALFQGKSPPSLLPKRE